MKTFELKNNNHYKMVMFVSGFPCAPQSGGISSKPARAVSQPSLFNGERSQAGKAVLYRFPEVLEEMLGALDTGNVR